MQSFLEANKFQCLKPGVSAGPRAKQDIECEYKRTDLLRIYMKDTHLLIRIWVNYDLKNIFIALSYKVS